MKTRASMLFAVLLVAPALGWTQQKQARAAESTPTPATSLSISNGKVRAILLAHSRRQSTAALGDVPELETKRRLALKFRSDSRVDHVDCDTLHCYAYTKDGRILYSTPRAQYFGHVADRSTSQQAWLACQDTNNLLSTFERFDNCRDAGIAFSLSGNGGPNGINVPPRR